MLSGEHRVTAGLQPGGPRQIRQQFQGLPGDAVLAVVDIEVADGQREFGTAVRILGEQVCQMNVADRVVVLRQCLPCGVAVMSALIPLTLVRRWVEGCT